MDSTNDNVIISIADNIPLDECEFSIEEQKKWNTMIQLLQNKPDYKFRLNDYAE